MNLGEYYITFGRYSQTDKHLTGMDIVWSVDWFLKGIKYKHFHCHRQLSGKSTEIHTRVGTTMTLFRETVGF